MNTSGTSQGNPKSFSTTRNSYTGLPVSRRVVINNVIYDLYGNVVKPTNRLIDLPAPVRNANTPISLTKKIEEDIYLKYGQGVVRAVAQAKSQEERERNIGAEVSTPMKFQKELNTDAPKRFLEANTVPSPSKTVDSGIGTSSSRPQDIIEEVAKKFDGVPLSDTVLRLGTNIFGDDKKEVYLTPKGEEIVREFKGKKGKGKDKASTPPQPSSPVAAVSPIAPPLPAQQTTPAEKKPESKPTEEKPRRDTFGKATKRKNIQPPAVRKRAKVETKKAPKRKVPDTKPLNARAKKLRKTVQTDEFNLPVAAKSAPKRKKGDTVKISKPARATKKQKVAIANEMSNVPVKRKGAKLVGATKKQKVAIANEMSNVPVKRKSVKLTGTAKKQKVTDEKVTRLAGGKIMRRLKPVNYQE